MLIQKVLSEIRELRQEELDLVGGAYTAELTMELTYSLRNYCSQRGCSDFIVPDDGLTDSYND